MPRRRNRSAARRALPIRSVMASRSCWSTKPANWTTEARAAAMNAKTIKEDQAQAFDTAHWPTEIKYIAAEKCLVVSFDTGETFRYPAEFLRGESPSAEVQGHGPGQKQGAARRRQVGRREIAEENSGGG